MDEAYCALAIRTPDRLTSKFLFVVLGLDTSQRVTAANATPI